MKFAKNTITNLFGFLLIFTVLLSCDSDDVQDMVEAEDELAILEIDDLTAEADNVIDDILITEGLLSKESVEEKNLDMTCKTKTVVTSGNKKSITIDFGEGCESPNGNVLKGIILLTIEFDNDLKTKSIETTYDGFFVNDREITGSKSILKERSNSNGNFQSTITFNQTIYWPDGESLKKEGVKIREWISGKDTRKMRDNVFLITGSWEITKKDGTKLEAEVVEALRREMSCKFIVSGKLKVERPNLEGIIDYGDGTCDRMAMFTDTDGNETEIELKRRK